MGGDAEAKIDQLLEKFGAMESMYKGLHRTLFGEDGRTGLVKDVVVASEGVKSNKKDIGALTGWIKWGLPIAIALVNGSFLFILGVLLK